MLKNLIVVILHNLWCGRLDSVQQDRIDVQQVYHFGLMTGLLYVSAVAFHVELPVTLI